jgi:hypothetical protein
MVAQIFFLLNNYWSQILSMGYGTTTTATVKLLHMIPFPPLDSPKLKKNILPPSQIITRFDFSRYMYFNIHPDITYM